MHSASMMMVTNNLKESDLSDLKESGPKLCMHAAGGMSIVNEWYNGMLKSLYWERFDNLS